MCWIFDLFFVCNVYFNLNVFGVVGIVFECDYYVCLDIDCFVVVWDFIDD